LASSARCFSSATRKADVVIVGAGHNGLVAALLLAKQGLMVRAPQHTHTLALIFKNGAQAACPRHNGMPGCTHLHHAQPLTVGCSSRTVGQAHRKCMSLSCLQPAGGGV
jgi:pyruvate/2-oxoglutarate dehydrogenase complex dihydrolipoamide dehydrogenase (E3) component